MLIRKYTDNDTQTLINLLRLNTPAYFAAEEEEDYIKYLKTEAENYYLLEVDGKVVGAGGINYVADERKALIAWDFLHPNEQGKGLGSHLANFRLDAIKTSGRADTVVVRTSQLAYRFYEKFGFRLLDAKKNYWAKGFDLYYMELPL